VRGEYGGVVETAAELPANFLPAKPDRIPDDFVVQFF
jgi:hypothetical protein